MSVCPHCHQPMPSSGGKRPREETLVVPRPSGNRGTATLLPVIVPDYAPYTGGQLLSVASRQVRACAQQWDRYYTHNTVNGYKDRHYLLREFAELHNALEALRHPNRQGGGVVMAVSVAEIGCGVGNAIIPILEEYADVSTGEFVAYGFDISKVAVDLLRQKILQAPTTLGGGRLTAIPHDLAEHDLALGGEECLLPGPVRFGTIVFVLCSVPVPKQQAFVDRVADIIAPGGYVFVRDYCVGDMAESRFAEGGRFAPSSATAECAPEDASSSSEAGTSSSLTSSTYLRSNGTLSHFFTVESLTKLFIRTRKFRVVQAVEVDRVTENRRAGAVMHRKFVQARFERLAEE